MSNFAADHGIKVLALLEQALGVIADPQKSLCEIVISDNVSNGHYLELKRMQTALKTYLDTDSNLRYVALVGSFSSGKTATINNLIEIAGTEQARLEDTNPADDKLTLCAHESKEQSLIATLVKSTWEGDKFLHQAGDLADEQCTKQIGSAIEDFASLIDVYVTWINTAGNMLLIERAHLAKDIDFLQNEKIGDQQKIETTRNLIESIFRTDRLAFAEIERGCAFFPDELKKWSGECDALSKQVDDLGSDILRSRLLPDLAVLSPIWDEAIQPLIDRYEVAQEEQRERLLSFLSKKYDDALTDFEVNKARVVSAWKKRIKIVGSIGVAFITLLTLGYYRLSAEQSGTEAIIIGAGGNALWVFLCAIYQRIKSDDKSWTLKSKRSTFEAATTKVLEEARRIELIPPTDLVEVQDQCRARLATALTQLVAAKAKQIRSLADSLTTEIDGVRRSGRRAVEAYRAEWEKARRIIETLYQQSDDKADKFNSVATAFKEKTMDRTRQLFGDRGTELESYGQQLLECVTAMREIH